MPNISTYSFLDVTGFLATPWMGQYTFTGQGIGEITVTMDIERTAHDVAADGSIMVSKIAGNSGRVTIQVQQTSQIYHWMVDDYNLAIISDPILWAGASVFIRSIADGTTHICTGVSYTKLPDKVYTGPGQRLAWILMAADIQTITA